MQGLRRSNRQSHRDAASLAARQTPCRSLTSGSNWGVAPVPRPMMAYSGGHHLPLPRSNKILGSNTDAAASPSSLVCPRVAQGQNPTAAAFQGKNASTLSPPAQAKALAQPGPHGGSAQLALWQPASCPCPYAGCTHAGAQVEFTCRTRAAAAQPLPAPSAEQEAMLHLAQQSAPPTSSASLWHQRPSAPSRVTTSPSLAPTSEQPTRLSNTGCFRTPEGPAPGSWA